MRLRPLVPLLALTLLAATTVGCADKGDPAASCTPSEIPDHDESTVVVEGDPWSGYALFRQHDLLSQATGRYGWVYVEQLCQDVRAADVSAGRAGFEVTTLDQYLFNRPAGTVGGVFHQSRGAAALVLNTARYPQLKRVDNIRALV